MLVAKLLMGLILSCAMGMGIACFLPRFDFFGWTGTNLTLILFVTSIYKVLNSDRIKTVYLCGIITVAFITLCVGHFDSAIFSIYFLKFYQHLYGAQYRLSILNISSGFWIGFILFSAVELCRKPERKLSLAWKIYAVLALVNFLAIVGYSIYNHSGAIY